MTVVHNDSYHEYESSVSPKGQITLPGRTRKKLGLRPRDKVKIKVFTDGRIMIEPYLNNIFSHFRTAPALKKPLTIEQMREIAYAERYSERNT